MICSKTAKADMRVFVEIIVKQGNAMDKKGE
jgi:hypothetical protein